MHFVSGSEPGIRRLGQRRFRYVDETTSAAVGPDDEQRIRALAIPPAWTSVWISADPDAHLQAWGRDAKGRKQYRYHPDYRAQCEATKFEQLLPFASGLGALRRRVDTDLRRPALDHDRVVAAVVRLLDMTLLRVGNEEYARTNGSFGLTTLRDRHVSITAAGVRLRFAGKSGHRFDVDVASPRMARVVRRCQELPGQVLFQYVDGARGARPVSSNDVNEYLRRHSRVDATAKTFRTWGASALAAELLADAPEPGSRRESARVVNAAIDEVAAHLGNTRSVCRASYVHPLVIASYLDGSLPAAHRAPRSAPRGLSPSERRLVGLLRAAA